MDAFLRVAMIRSIKHISVYLENRSREWMSVAKQAREKVIRFKEKKQKRFSRSKR